MATPQLSPGVLTREVDLTVGRADNVLDNIGAIAGPFTRGPVNYPVEIATEQDLINNFGKPLSEDGQYEYWMSASSFLSYGGILRVVRTGSEQYLVNANAIRTGVGDPDIYIKNPDDYENNHSTTSPDYMFVARTPGTWANDLKVAIIDDKADQILTGVTTVFDTYTESFNEQIANRSGTLIGYGSTIVGIDTSGISLGKVVRCDLSNTISTGTTVIGIAVTEVVGFGTTSVVTLSTSSLQAVNAATTFDFGTIVSTGSTVTIQPGYAVTTAVSTTFATVGGAGTNTFNGYLKAIVTGVGNNNIEVKIVSTVSNDGTESKVSYAERSRLRSFLKNDTIRISSIAAGIVTTTTLANNDNSVLDWYDQQTIELTNTTISWKSIAPRPITNEYVADRSGGNDGIHICVFDDTGSVTGIQGNILEKHVHLSKASDAISRVNSPQKIWYKDYIASASNYVYGGMNPSNGNVPEEPIVATTFSSGITPQGLEDGLWETPCQNTTYNAIGNVLYNLTGGYNYIDNGYGIELGDILESYDIFSNVDDQPVDYLIMGPGFTDKVQSQAKANHLISIAEQRKDCMAVISPHRDAVVNVPKSEDQTNNIIEFFSSINGSGDSGAIRSSSYTVLDSGYKYTYDRFNNRFRYIPCNPDVAGLMVRTAIQAQPWFSPAGQQRGILNNAIKVAYNPSKQQRDRLYQHRINAIINQPGLGVLLFGDKTALGYASAFDRINVRRLFLTIEQALKRAAEVQLFEINDELTRANFVNIVDPYLRDVQAKRGIFDYLIICDGSNNTPDTIDNNEFRADIFIKPTKSINYVTLTFVATRTGASFDEVAGRV